jgi:hypothetical protein
MINIILSLDVKGLKKSIYEVCHSLLFSQWWFLDPSGSMLSLTRQTIVKPSNYAQLTRREFHRYRTHNALPKSLKYIYTVKKIRIVGNLCYYQKPFWVSESFGNLLKEFPNGSETQKGF